MSLNYAVVLLGNVSLLFLIIVPIMFGTWIALACADLGSNYTQRCFERLKATTVEWLHWPAACQ